MSGRYRDEFFVSKERDDARIEIASRRSRSRAGSPNRTPVFLRDDRPAPIGGQMVLRQREVETGVRHRSPSPVSVRSERRIIRERSTSPVERVVIRERSRSRGPTERVRLVERGRSPEPSVERIKVVERSRSRRRTPSPDTYRTRVLEREREIDLERDVEIRRAPSPNREVIRGPIIERDVVTHWRDIDHGVVRVPSPPRRSTLTRETDIDIDIRRSGSRSRARSRSRSRSRVRRLSHERLPTLRYQDDTEIVVRTDRERLRIDEREGRHRSHSAVPLRSPSPSYSEEADYITSRIEARGRTGEAYHGATRDWTIVDVPPGTERVRMDGAGGGGAEVTWQRYNGVRRSRFIPGGEEKDIYVRGDRAPRDSGRELVIADSPTNDSKVSVQIYDREKDREIDIETSRRKSRTSTDMWTEITKDLVCKEALDEAGYEYEETEWFFYVMQYLRYEDVLDLVSRTERIRRTRRRAHEIEYDRDYRDYREYHDHRDSYQRDRESSHRFHVGGGTRRHHYDLDIDFEREKERDYIVDRRY